jgi:hypothetical protein
MSSAARSLALDINALRSFSHRLWLVEMTGWMNLFLGRREPKAKPEDRVQRTDMLFQLARRLWDFLRESAGENDYKRYRIRALARGECPVGNAEFYLSRLEEKYSRPNRCC